VVELMVDAGDVRLSATLVMPHAGRVRGGVIPLHGAGAGDRSFFLYEHLAQVLPGRGIAVLRYDRRPSRAGEDVPLDVQAGDARAAMGLLRDRIAGCPVGLWGFSQGGWAAPLAAATWPGEVAFLIVVSSCGVSPAAQMRFGAAEQLRRHGYGKDDLRQLDTAAAAAVEYLRGDRDRRSAQALVDDAARRPWFRHAGIPRQLPERGAWADMDFDPGPVFARVSCPVLAFYGETDQWIPVGASISAWRRAREASGSKDLTVATLPGCDHTPADGEGTTVESISPLYTRTMISWLDAQLS
jgi:pimeloyl-ACP methyl ester carboxylesterase